ncbi:MAG TPA: hypothetical protein VM940_16500 [Chthoniobacterales bacterium]|jgi:hypothetical protein|nr:hypothetical protein [Chthoniobacterales bacterium]
MHVLLTLFVAATTLAAAPRPEGAMTFQAYDQSSRLVATHTVVPPADAAGLSPTQFFARLAAASGRHRQDAVYWLGPIYRHNHEKPSDFVFYDGKIGKTSPLLVKDLRPGDLILIYVEYRG